MKRTDRVAVKRVTGLDGRTGVITSIARYEAMVRIDGGPELRIPLNNLDPVEEPSP